MRRDFRDIDRVKAAVRALATGEADVRWRVARACQILQRLQSSEMSDDIRDELQAVLTDAQRFPAAYDQDGNVLKSRFEETARRSRKASAKKLAERLYSLIQRR